MTRAGRSAALSTTSSTRQRPDDRIVEGGIIGVRASSSAADADATLRLGLATGRPRRWTAIRRRAGSPATFGRSSGEWLELTFASPRTLDDLKVQFSLAAPTTEAVRTLTGRHRSRVADLGRSGHGQAAAHPGPGRYDPAAADHRRGDRRQEPQRGLDRRGHAARTDTR